MGKCTPDFGTTFELSRRLQERCFGDTAIEGLSPGTRRTSGVRSSRIGAALPLRLGLGASLPLVGVELIALLIFIAQIILSSLWLSAFRYGPLEWIWRILTYGRYFPCRR